MSTVPHVPRAFFRLQASQPTPIAAPWRRYVAWYQCAVLGLALLAIYANLPVYGYVRNAALLPKYSFFLLFFLMSPLVLVHQKAFADYLLSPFMFWASALVAVNLIHLAGWSASGEIGRIVLVDTYEQMRASLISTRIQYILFAMMFGFAASTASGKTWLYAAVALAVLLPGAVLLDFAMPGLFYPGDINGAVLGRAAATFINPTTAGEALLHVFLLACAVTAFKYRSLLFLLVGAGVLVTFSRGSMIAWAVLLAILTWRRTLPRAAFVLTLAALAALVLSLGSLQHYLDSRDGFETAASNILARLNFFSSLSFEDDSAMERAQVAAAGWELFLQNPVFGAGAGATQFWTLRGGTHNQLLMLAAEYGVFGIGLWCWIAVILWRGRFFQDRGLQIGAVFVFAIMSMFTHQMFDAASYWLATFAMASARPAGGDREPTPRSRRRQAPARMRYVSRNAGEARKMLRSGGQP
jgi:O-antigen ligase